MNNRRLLLAVLSLVIAHCSLLAALGQSATATLSGTVEDQNGASVPGVEVAVLNVETSALRQATTNESGSFTIPLLPPGRYTVTARRDGFSAVEVPNLILNVGDQKALSIQLKPGDVNAAVTIEADASLVRTDGSVGTVIDQQFVKNIPLNGRTFQSLLTLTPGVVLAGGSVAFGQFSVNGQRTNSNYFTVDGVTAGSAPRATLTAGGTETSGQLPNLTAVGSTASLVTVDSLQEFRIQTSSYAPEFGRQPGGQVQLLTKSGTNDYHGTAFEYLRNEAFDANDWFANRNRLKRAPTRQHQFGGTFGGPLPFLNFGEGGGPLFHSGKDRTHFFLSYEALRLELPKVLSNGFVPTLCLRGTEPCPAGRRAAVAAYQPFLQAYPLPTGPELQVACTATDPDPLCVQVSPGVRRKPSGFAELIANYSDPSRYDATSVRLDHKVGKLTFFLRYNQTPSSSTNRLNSPSSSTASIYDSRGVTLGSTWAISDRIFNDVRFGYSKTESTGSSQLDDFGGAIPLSTLGFIGRTQESAFSTFTTLGLAGAGGLAYGTVSEFVGREFNIVDNLIFTAGDHQLKFGGDFRRNNPLVATGVQGLESMQVRFDQFLPGLVQSYFIETYDDRRHAPIFDNLSLYAQDTWRVNKRLTLTYGVRWEFIPPPHAAEGPEAITLDGPLEAPGILAPGALSVAPSDTPLWRTRYNNFAPRFGASFVFLQKPGRELVLRGGGGMFYDLGLGRSANGYAGGAWPFAANISYPIVGHPDPDCRPPLDFPLPACALIPPQAGANAPTELFILDRNLVLPRVYQWNFAAEQSLGSHQSVTVSYVGAAGRKLLSSSSFPVRLRNITYIGSATTRVFLQRNEGVSDYRALQLQYQRRLSQGLQALAAYTLASSKDTESEDGTGLPPEAFTHSYRYGYSDFDVRHNFNAAVTYQIPGFKGNSFLSAITRDWGVDLRFSARTGFPADPTVVGTVPGLPGSSFIRPNRVEGQPLWVEDVAAPGGRRVNLVAFMIPPPNTVGDLSRGTVRGFPLLQLDMSLHRDFPLIENVRLQLRADVFNVTNTPNFSFGAGNVRINTSSRPETFGAASAMLNRGTTNGLNALYQSGGPRSMQFSARVSF